MVKINHVFRAALLQLAWCLHQLGRSSVQCQAATMLLCLVLVLML